MDIYRTAGLTTSQHQGHFMLLILCLLTVNPSTSTKDVGEYCQNESFKAKCAEGEVVVMRSALYGRMRFSRCIDRDYGYVGQCSRDVLDTADVMCSGRRQCEINVPNSLLDSKKPCPKDLKSYLETSHACLKVTSSVGLRCRPGQAQLLTGDSGHIASVLTEESGLGSADCPWMIQGQPGQRINFTLLDFATVPEGGEICHAYAILREKQPTRSITICGGTQRQKNVYTSISHQVEIRILRSQSNNKGRYFVIKYQMLGCGDYERPAYGWAERDGNTATVGCDATGDAWRITCKGSSWVGYVGNCTQAAGVVGEVSWGGTSLPFGVSIVIIIGIALAIGVVILLVGLIVLKWQRRRSTKASRLQGGGGGGGPYQTSTGRKSISSRHNTPIAKEQDPYYSENEYAYISDMPLPPPPIQTMTEGRDTYISSSMKRTKYNNHGGPYTGYEGASPARATGYMKNTHAHGLHEEQPRYEESVMPPYPSDSEDPPKYFELDPKAVKGVDMSRLPTKDGSSHQNEVVPVPVAPRMHKSIHEFSPSSYDHLGQEEENKNHKSV